jgi:hypothetical protein
MKISRKQLRRIIKEYEQYVDEDGNVWDDEGNVTRRGAAFGRRYGGGTYGTNAPWQGGRSRYSSQRRTTHVGANANADKIAAVEKALEAKPNKFLSSILTQLKGGRGLSAKQNKIVKRILSKTAAAESASLFESFAATAQEEAEKINAQAGPGMYGMTLVTDQSFWEERGIITGEELAFSILSQSYSDAYKSLHGIRPRWAKFETVDEVQAAIDDLDREAEAMAEDDAYWASREAEWEKERQELAALQVPGLDLEYEKVAQRSGMGRRHESILRVSKKQLRETLHKGIHALELNIKSLKK